VSVCVIQCPKTVEFHPFKKFGLINKHINANRHSFGHIS